MTYVCVLDQCTTSGVYTVHTTATIDDGTPSIARQYYDLYTVCSVRLNPHGSTV